MTSMFYGPRAGAVEAHEEYTVNGERMVFVELEIGPSEVDNDNDTPQERVA